MQQVLGGKHFLFHVKFKDGGGAANTLTIDQLHRQKARFIAICMSTQGVLSNKELAEQPEVKVYIPT